MEATTVLEKVQKILEDKKAIDVVVIDTKDKTSLADYFVVASGTSSTHIRALADNVELELKKENILPYKIQGYDSNSWVLMDYSDVVVHIFTEQDRVHYNLEDLWQKVR